MSEPGKPIVTYASGTLRREVGLGGAVMLGLGSMIGTGVFVGIGQATAIAGPWVLVAVLLAAGLALCNALSSAQLAAAHPVAGGTYEYGYRLLNPTLGFIAGWTFLLAKSASAATAVLALADVIRVTGSMAIMTFGEMENSWDWRGLDEFTWIWRTIPPAIPLLLLGALSVGVLAGLRKVNWLNTVLVFLSLFGLLQFVLVLGLDIRVWDFDDDIPKGREVFFALAQSTALAFVAFTGYGRLATLGEEVRDPEKSIPRAIGVTIAAVACIYFAVAACLVGVPSAYVVIRHGYLYELPDIYEQVVWREWLHALHWVISLAAVTAMLGVLLNLILGLSRVWLAMGRRGDMPALLARVNEKSSTPVPAVLVTGVVIGLLVLVGDLRLTWAFSAFTVLIYYAITNLAALRLPPEQRLYPRLLAWIGLVACASLAWFVPIEVWLAGVVLIVVGLAWHHTRRRIWSGV